MKENIILTDEYIGRCEHCRAEIAGSMEPVWIVDVERLSDGTPVAMMNKAHFCFVEGMRKAALELIEPPDGLKAYFFNKARPDK